LEADTALLANLAILNITGYAIIIEQAKLSSTGAA
jgi:hypothetical protein